MKIIISLALMASLAACGSGDGSGGSLGNPSRSASAPLGLSFQNLANSALSDDGSLGANFPRPELPPFDTPFQVQPTMRFERWTFSAMTQSAQTGDWQWSQQEFIRMTLGEANGEANAAETPKPQSKWAFNDLIAQRYTHYDFGNQTHLVDASADRVALGLATLAADEWKLNGVSLAIENKGCRSSFALSGDERSLVWKNSRCPQRVRVNDTVIASANSEVANGVGWVSHSYGQLPTGLGAVVIERIRVVLPDGSELDVNRSRRRNGGGPLTVAATLNGQTLRGVQWTESIAARARLPNVITVNVPTLAQTFSIKVPETMSAENYVTGSTIEHGVIVSTNSEGSQILPGVVSLYPLDSEVL